MHRIPIKVKRLVSDASIPRIYTKGSAGNDIKATGDIQIPAGQVTPVSTGLAFEIPEDCYMDIRPRGGLSQRKIFIANSPGTLDSDYRGELKILLFNAGQRDYIVRKGDRIAQILVSPLTGLDFEEVEELSETIRGEGGFGHTGR